jgi:hypothetical protein
MHTHGGIIVVLQDGDLVSYSNGARVWASNTAGNPQAYVTLQNNGDLVIFNALGQAIWSVPNRPGGVVVPEPSPVAPVASE